MTRGIPAMRDDCGLRAVGPDDEDAMGAKRVEREASPVGGPDKALNMGRHHLVACRQDAWAAPVGVRYPKGAPRPSM